MVEELTYFIDTSKRSSKCKKCKEDMPKGSIRIGTRKDEGDKTVNSFSHPACFNLTRAHLKDEITPTIFVQDHLEDLTDDLILSDGTKAQEIIDAIASKKKGAKKGEDGEDDAIGARIAEIKKVLKEMRESGDDDSDDEKKMAARPAKKAKGEEESGGDVKAYAKALKVYEKMKNDDLKDVLRWNLGYGTTGNKDVLLLRVLDGHVNGRLSRCPTCCKGKLKLSDKDGGATILCGGFFDETIGRHQSCPFEKANKDAPASLRLHPWYSTKPTEEQVEAMKAITLEQEGNADGAVGANAGEVPPELIEGAKKLKWEVSDGQGMKEAAVAMLELVKDVVDVPTDPKKAMIGIGKIVVANREKIKTATGILELVVQEYGIAERKEAAAAKQQEAMEDVCVCPENAPLCQALKELGDLYMKEGNWNASNTYKKAVAAVTELAYEVTADNAKGLGKSGKTKVANIGKGTAEKMHEFVTKGTIGKLEEKRALQG